MKWPWQRKPQPPVRHPLPGWPAAARHPDSLADDLRRHLYESISAIDPGEGRGVRVHWVMTADWYTECRKIGDPASGYLWEPSMTVSTADRILGIPVQIRDGSGPPHLEPVQ